MRYARWEWRYVKNENSMLPVELFYTHQHIGLDLDETLAITISWMVEFSQSQGKLLHISSIEDIKSNDSAGFDPTMDPGEISKLWELYGKATITPDTIPVVKWAIQWTEKLHKLGKSLSIITARNNQEYWRIKRTHDWVQMYFPFIGFENIHFVNHHSDEAKPKSEICVSKGVTLMIDDTMENIEDLCNNGIACILLERPWNLHSAFNHHLLYRAKDWREIIDTIDQVHV